ncbi:MAG: hypothetical protein Q8K69_01545 [Bacteroidota bacterium]|nr:hypothetical protein [Bacteroidota bacterium]MDP3434709.1 hypothetical protein [Bacteroidota bacterium]
MNPKLKSMLAHFTPIGWFLAFLLNSIKKDSMTGFYLRQLLGLYICFFLSWYIPDYYIIAWGFLFVLWTYSFIGTVKSVENLIPIIGALFQKWFQKIA